MAISSLSSSALTIKRLVDAILPKSHAHHVTHGQALVAMIINGLGFHGRSLHMIPKPTERLIAPGIEPRHLNDDAWMHCLKRMSRCFIRRSQSV